MSAAPSRPGGSGFPALMVTQFFGAANDNLLKGVLSFAVAVGGIWADRLGAGGQAYIGLCLTVPFILLSGIAGQVADRTSKQKVTLAAKVAEIGIAGVGLLGFWIGSLVVAMLAMLLLAVQSAFFGPAKFGMIPELVGRPMLSRANGLINMFTNIAVIAGTLAAGPVYDLYDPSARADAAAAGSPPLLWAPGAVLLMVALAGLAAACFLPPLRAMKPGLPMEWRLFRPYVRAVRDMAKTPLLPVALAWAFFYLVGMMALLILPDYRELLGVSATKASYLLGVLGVAIGAGSVTAGIVSGYHIEPRLVPVGAVGMTVSFALLGSTPLHFGTVAALLSAAGFFAGFYIVPLQALLQHLSPDDERGRFLGTANALSFVASTAGTLIFLAARKLFDIPSNRVFLICAALAALGTGALIWRLRHLLVDPTVRGGTAPG